LPFARQFDKMVLECALSVMGLKPTELTAALRTQMYLPIRAGGLGLRSYEETAPMAYFASVSMAIPHMTRIPDSVQERGMADALRRFRAQGFEVSELVPLSMSDWFRTYEYGAPKDLQKSLVATYEARHIDHLMDRYRADPLLVDDYLRLTGAAKKGASLWLTT